MSQNYFSVKKLCEIFGGSHLKSELLNLEKSGKINPSKKFRSGAILKRGWPLEDVPSIGEHLGFMKSFNKPVALAVFTTKGGVLKSTMALNIARMAALHNIKTCVVGLDIQGDITTALGHENDVDDCDNLDEIIEKLNRTKGLADLFHNHVRLEDIIKSTDIPTLSLIPETPELVALNDSLNNMNRREYWLQEKIVSKLKGYFDLIVMDCSPNWNKLTTNALVACDVLISPLECKINNFRNFKVFKLFIKEFKDEMHLDFENIFIPTKYCANRKLGMEIKNWYQVNVSGCTSSGFKESVISEEACALHKAVLEHAPSKSTSKEMRELLIEIGARVDSCLESETTQEQTEQSYQWDYDYHLSKGLRQEDGAKFKRSF
ncbi:MAG: ParA family protein [Bacteriovoracaceae bacterium]|nr:ParA family protein [Bacteriovoracaceae bacterium]